MSCSNHIISTICNNKKSVAWLHQMDALSFCYHTLKTMGKSIAKISTTKKKKTNMIKIIIPIFSYKFHYLFHNRLIVYQNIFVLSFNNKMCVCLLLASITNFL